MQKALILYISIALGLLACQTEKQSQKEEKAIKNQEKRKAKDKAPEIIRTKTTSDKDKKMTEIVYSELDNLDEGLKAVLDKMKEGERVKIVCYGNSITNGYKVGAYGKVQNPYPETLEKLLREKYNNNKVSVINEGHNGWTSNQALQNINTLVLSKKPDLLTLMFGINDAYSNFSLDFYENQIEAMIEKAQSENITVLLLSPTPILTEFNGKVLAYIEVLQAIAKERKVAFLNINKGITQKAKVERVDLKKMLPDDVHFADDKYAWLGELIFEFLEEKE